MQYKARVIRFGDVQWAKLKKAARNEQTSAAALVRQAVTNYLR